MIKRSWTPRPVRIRKKLKDGPVETITYPTLPTRQPLSPDVNKKTTKDSGIKISDILSFASAILAFVSAAIFYIAGWVYEAHWYSFFGINLSQIKISTEQIMIDGVPGILILAFSVLLMALIWGIYKRINGKVISVDDIPIIVIGAYIFAGIIILGLILWNYKLVTPLPFELIFSAFGITLQFVGEKQEW